MPRTPSPAQRAVQITFVLKGHLKSARIAYIRAAILLARIRDEKLWQALHHRSLAEYARKHLRLQESTLYKYLEVHDWLKARHPAWLAKRPKGFIPELSDVEALSWIEKRLESPELDPGLRKELESARRKALAGELSSREFSALRSSGRKALSPIRDLLGRTRALRRVANRLTGVPPAAIAGYDAAIRSLEAAAAAVEPIAKLLGMRATTLARLGHRDATTVLV